MVKIPLDKRSGIKVNLDLGIGVETIDQRFEVHKTSVYRVKNKMILKTGSVRDKTIVGGLKKLNVRDTRRMIILSIKRTILYCQACQKWIGPGEGSPTSRTKIFRTKMSRTNFRYTAPKFETSHTNFFSKIHNIFSQ